MKNKILAITRDIIPYVKQLRQIVEVKSASTAILMQQLDYWFSYSKGKPFYKFSQPCKNVAYKEGDSWCEELGFSIDEFRTAFNNIGIKYLSMTEYNKAKESGVCPFNGKFYLAYTDKIKGITFYHRNHELLDLILDNVCVDTLPIYYKSQSTCMETPNLRRLTMPIYVNGECQSTYMENGNPEDTETTTEITTETTTEKKEEERERASDFSAIKNFKDFSSQETENANEIADENDFASIPVQYSKDRNADYQAYKEQKQQKSLTRINTNTSVQFPSVFDKQLETMPENSNKIEFEKQINIAMGLWEEVLINTGMKYKTAFEKEKQINTLCKFDIGFVIDRLEMCLEKKWGQIVWEDITEKYNIWKSKNTTTQTFKATKTFLSKKPKTNIGYEKDGMVNGIYYADHDTNNENYDPRTNPEDKQYHYAFDRRSEMYLDDTVGKQTKYQWWDSKFGDNDY